MAPVTNAPKAAYSLHTDNGFGDIAIFTAKSDAHNCQIELTVNNTKQKLKGYVSFNDYLKYTSAKDGAILVGNQTSNKKVTITVVAATHGNGGMLSQVHLGGYATTPVVTPLVKGKPAAKSKPAKGKPVFTVTNKLDLPKDFYKSASSKGTLTKYEDPTADHLRKVFYPKGLKKDPVFAPVVKAAPVVAKPVAKSAPAAPQKTVAPPPAAKAAPAAVQPPAAKTNPVAPPAQAKPATAPAKSKPVAPPPAAKPAPVAKPGTAPITIAPLEVRPVALKPMRVSSAKDMFKTIEIRVQNGLKLFRDNQRIFGKALISYEIDDQGMPVVTSVTGLSASDNARILAEYQRLISAAFKARYEDDKKKPDVAGLASAVQAMRNDAESEAAIRNYPAGVGRKVTRTINHSMLEQF